MSRPIIGRVPRPTRSPIRGRLRELIRQWSSLHPEFSYLPRKFKIAVTGAPNDRAAVKVHDIGLRLHKNDKGERRLGSHRRRRPGPHADDRRHGPRLPAGARTHRLSRSDHARLQSLWPARQQVQGAHQDPGARTRRRKSSAPRSRRNMPATPEQDNRSRGARARAHRRLFRAAAFRDACRAGRPPSRRRSSPIRPSPAGPAPMSRRTGSTATRIVNISLKPEGGIPGDATSDQMRAGGRSRRALQLRRNPRQPCTEPRSAACEARRSSSPSGRRWRPPVSPPPISGLPATSSPAPASTTARWRRRARFRSRRRSRANSPISTAQQEIGPLKINISGCINACGHHHVGHIGILGLDKKGEEFYQITLGGSSAESASIGTILGPGFAGHEVPDAIEKILDTYLKPAPARRGIPRRLSPAWRRSLSRRPSMPLLKNDRFIDRQLDHVERTSRAARVRRHRGALFARLLKEWER